MNKQIKAVTEENKMSMDSIKINTAMDIFIMRGQNFFHTNILATQSVEAIKKYILSGLSVSYLPRCSVEKEAEEGFLKIKTFKTELQLFTQIIYHKNKWINPAIKEFIELSQKHSRKWI